MGERPMIEVSVTERVEASAAAVWALVGDFNLVRRWMPSVEHSTKMGEGIGTERILLISGGARVIERLDALDEAARSLTYSFVAGPLPVASCATTLAVIEEGAMACTVSWSSRIEPEGLAPEEIARLYRELYRAGCANLRRLMARPFPPARTA